MTPDEPLDHFADRLAAATRAKRTPACVGLDPVVERLPEPLRQGAGDGAEAVESFSLGVLAAVEGAVGVVKVQSACFERFGAEGLTAMRRVIGRAHEYGLVVILDAKRGDIGVSAAHYAAFAFGAMDADAVTVNASLGADTLEPYLAPEHAGRGVFVLVRTSNPGSDGVQSKVLIDGRSVAEMTADLVANVAAGRMGACGLSDVGAVVAATKPADARALRERLPRSWILVPGFGAQGGTPETVRDLFRADGSGAIVTASRSVIYAFEGAGGDWRAAVRDAAARFARQIAGLAHPAD
ncbi:MAG: orotidine-5'-phosphate decarboxylase [Planctomycetota bacterium]|nr:MAG: orotidine-5'-phosphate decarboxylase [Planctomycetota bacterium]